MARSESTVRVGITQKQAFQMWSDFVHLSDFLPSVSDVQPTGDGAFLVQLQVGDLEESTKIVLTAIEKPRRLVWRSTGGARWNGELVFRPTVEGTEIRFIVDFEPNSLRANPMGRGALVPTWNVGDDLLSFRNYAEKVRTEERQMESEPEAVGA